MSIYGSLYEFAIAQTDLDSKTSCMLLCVALSAANSALGVPEVARRYLATMNKRQDKLAWIEFVRAALVKSAPLCSFPRSANTMRALVEGLDSDLRSQLSTIARSRSSSMEEELARRQRGLKLYNTWYAERAEPVKKMFASTHPDLWVMVEDIYGHHLSDTGIINTLDTELLVIVSNQVMGAEPQFADHLKNVHNAGVSESMLRAAVRIGARVKDATR